MKKIKYLILSLFVALTVTGCGAKPEDVLKEASENMKKLDNYHMDLVMDMKMSYEGATMSMSVSAKSDIDEKNGKGSMETSASFFGISQTEQSYFTVTDGKTTTYSQSENEDGETVWYKEVEDGVSNEIDFDIFANASSIEEVDGEKNTYKITLSESQIKELIAATGEDATDAEYSDMTIKVTVEDKYITKLVMEMNVEGSECTFTFEFSKFNNVKVEIPSDVINNAIEEYDYE